MSAGQVKVNHQRGYKLSDLRLSIAAVARMDRSYLSRTQMLVVDAGHT
jgi:hypothetical protein